MLGNENQFEPDFIKSLNSSKGGKKAIDKAIDYIGGNFTEEEEKLLLHFLLHRRETSTTPITNPVYMRMVVTEAMFRHFIVVLADIPVRDLVYELMTQFDLPTMAANGQTICYRLFARKKSGEYCVLLPRATLAQQEIGSECEFVLFPDVDV